MSSETMEDRITLEFLDDYFRGTYKKILNSILVPLIVVVVMWSQVDHVILVAWLCLMAVGIIAKHQIAADYIKQDVAWADANKWGRRATYPVFFLGMLWAVAMFVFYVDGSTTHQIFLITVILALGTASMFAGIYWFPLYYMYTIPITGSLVIRLAMEGEAAYIALAFWIFLGALGIHAIAKRLHALVRSEMRLRHESAELTEALREKSEEAEQAMQAKSRFLAAASHDLRQPLHSLALFIDLLKSAQSDAERADLFPRVDRSLGALSKLFDALLDISRLDADAVRPEFTHFHLADLVGSLVDEFAQTANDKNLSLRQRGDCGVVVSDRMLLERILRNLIGNALRYTEEGGVLISCRSRGDSILLQVWDTGIGIPDADREAVFDEYYQLHNPHRDRNQGLGLGLSIVRRLCLLLQHPLEVNSRVGKGSVFSLRVQKGSAGMIRGREALQPAHGWDLNGRCIVVIDDESDIRNAMEKLLSRWGGSVVVAESLADAFDQLAEVAAVPDLILSDLRLRDGASGIDAIDSLRSRFGEGIPGILITGETAPEQIGRAKSSGYDLLQKPVQPVRLRSAIQRYLAEGC